LFGSAPVTYFLFRRLRGGPRPAAAPH